MTEIVFPADGVAKCNGGGLLAGEQEQKILQLIAMNHSMKRACDERDAEIAALREAVRLAYITRGHKEDGMRTLIFRADAGVDWHFDLSADSVNAVFRALEGKP